MIYDKACQQEEKELVSTTGQAVALLEQCVKSLSKASSKRRGRPAQVSWTHLSLGIVLCFLRGWRSQLDLWRLIGFGVVGCFVPVLLSDQAIYNRLARAAVHMRTFYEQVSAKLAEDLSAWQERGLAPFATQVLALDESPLDQVGRYLPNLRQLACGDPALLAGRISGLFNVRTGQWARVDLLPKAIANCKVHARNMVSGLQEGTLLLFDRGYLSFALFDDLSNAGLYWISRSANRVSYRVLHVCYCGDGVCDLIISLGKYRADGARTPVRLVSFWVKGHHYQYLTNVLDPHQLSLAEIARLYSRRWDIELAFRVLKDHLGINEPWSAKWSVVGLQIWTGLLLAQLFHALQLQVASRAGVDLFEVSIALLIRLTPSFLQQGRDPIEQFVRFGRDMGVIRPSSRVVIQVPHIDPRWVSSPPPEALRPREKVRHAQRKCGSRSKKETLSPILLE